MKKNIVDYFKYIVLGGVMFIPFIYSFFYLKAYWDPYGLGNMDNLPVALVNNDTGISGNDFSNSLINSNSIKFVLTNEDDALKGLNNGRYYALILIPSNFTDSIDSINDSIKYHPTITYSPNQKTNYLASQIIDRVIREAESNLENTINSSIIESLETNLNQVPEKLSEISNGFDSMEEGVKSLSNGSSTIKNGSKELYNSYLSYNKGIKEINKNFNLLLSYMNEFNNGLNTLNESITNINKIPDATAQLESGTNKINDSMNTYYSYLNNYISSINNMLDYTYQVSSYIVNVYDSNNLHKDNMYYQAKQIIDNNLTSTLQNSGLEISNSTQTLKSSINSLNDNITLLNSNASSLNDIKDSIYTLSTSSNQLLNSTSILNKGIDDISKYSDDIEYGIKKVYNGTNTLNDGLNTFSKKLNNSKNELNINISTTKENLASTSDIVEFSKNPINLNKEVINEVSTYGTAFAPLFISISLWVGCLMIYIIIYYDKKERFKVLGEKNNNELTRLLLYHIIISVASILLGGCLDLFLDLNITNKVLYYLSLIITANTFLSIMEFLIINFKDVGKFIALIILILQLAASGGTFPIETVSKGFRFLNNFLPMTYSIKLFKESLIHIDKSLLTNSLLTLIIITILLTIINIARAYKKNKGSI